VEESVEKEGKCAGESTCLARSNAHVQGKLTMLVVLTNHFGPQHQEREHASAIAPTRFARTRVALRVSSPELAQRAEPNRCGALMLGLLDTQRRVTAMWASPPGRTGTPLICRGRIGSGLDLVVGHGVETSKGWWQGWPAAAAIGRPSSQVAGARLSPTIQI